MSKQEMMITPRLTDSEYDRLVESWNRRVRRGPVVEPCAKHDWVRMPHDNELDPKMICVNCMRTMSPDIDK